MSDTDSITQDRSSLGSNDSKDQSKISALIDKARLKGKQLVSRRERKSPPRSEEIEETSPLLTGCSDSPVHSTVENETLVDIPNTLPSENLQKEEEEEEKESIPITIDSLAKRCRSMPFFRHRMYCLGVLIALTLIIPGFLTGLLWGLYVSFSGFLYLFVSDPGRATRSVQAARKKTCPSEDVDLALEANLDDEGTALGMKDHIVYRGWMNELRTRYSPGCYHVNNAQTVLVRLEGSTLRISRPAKAGLKHAFHQDPTLQQSTPSMTSQSIYDLMDAKVSLRPKRLAKRRWWSRKYPIHIRFPHKSSTRVEVDIDKPGMSRSISLHPVAGSREDKPTVSEIRPVDENGYSAESETSSDDEALQGVQRSNSAGDLVEFKLEPNKIKRGKGRSIYLFVRAAREKERWFHLLREACVKPVPDLNESKHRRSSIADEFKRSISEGFDCEGIDGESTLDTLSSFGKSFEYALYRRNHRQYAQEMLRILGNGIPCPEKDSTVSIDLGDMKWQPGIIEENSDLVESINALGARIFFDFSRDKFWENAVKQKIQSKLATIHLPYFIETLSLSELDLGGAAPRIVGVYAPKMNEWGLWVDFEMKYKGRIRLVLQTSVNLLKLQNGHNSVETERKISRWTDSVRTTHYSDEDLPESPESSPDEDFGAKNQSDGNRERTGKKILSIVEKAAQSKFFQKAAKHPRVAKFMEEMSSTPLILNVEIEQLEGTMTINIPPPPSDRLWHGFRNVPTVSIRAIPQVGDRSVDFSTVSDWIESKLRLLIEKNLVSPNMDDIVLPVMSGNSLLHFGYNK